MKISAKTEYACIAMIELAARYRAGEPVRIRSIAEEHAIPQRFLVQILLQLKGAGLVASTRGATGGYQLLKPPDEITLGEIVQLMEGPLEPGLTTDLSSPAVRTLNHALCEAADNLRAQLSATTLADLVQQMQDSTRDMYYI